MFPSHRLRENSSPPTPAERAGLALLYVTLGLTLPELQQKSQREKNQIFTLSDLISKAGIHSIHSGGPESHIPAGCWGLWILMPTELCKSEIV